MRWFDFSWRDAEDTQGLATTMNYSVRYIKLTPWSRVLLEDLSTQLVKKFPGGSLPCSQGPTHTTN